MKVVKSCSVSDCTRRYHARGYCNVHLARLNRTGSVELPPTQTLAERIESKIRYDLNGCWTWTGSLSTAGYGMMSVDARHRLVHRLAYEMWVREIPDGKHLDHLCRNRACINPAHLDVVTPRENVMRGMSPSAVIRRQGVCKHGHEMVGENIYVPPRKPQHQQCRTCRRARSAKFYARRLAA